MMTCPGCNGEGRTQCEDEVYSCEDCDGAGKLPAHLANHLLKDMKLQADADDRMYDDE